jgi:hypothetical protein
LHSADNSPGSTTQRHSQDGFSGRQVLSGGNLVPGVHRGLVRTPIQDVLPSAGCFCIAPLAFLDLDSVHAVLTGVPWQRRSSLPEHLGVSSPERRRDNRRRWAPAAIIAHAHARDQRSQPDCLLTPGHESIRGRKRRSNSSQFRDSNQRSSCVMHVLCLHPALWFTLCANCGPVPVFSYSW